MDRILSRIERLAVVSIFKALEDAKRQHDAIAKEARGVLEDLGLDPNQQFEIRPDGSLHVAEPVANNPPS